jgi:dienelactone hydrolase
MKPLHFAAAAFAVTVATAGFHAGAAKTAVKVQTIDYMQGGTTLEGWLVYDNAKKGERPGVVVFPAWNGPTQDEKQRAEMLAKLGYVVFSPTSTARASGRAPSRTPWRSRENT